jgi:hypothetical protein
MTGDRVRRAVAWRVVLGGDAGGVAARAALAPRALCSTRAATSVGAEARRIAYGVHEIIGIDGLRHVHVEAGPQRAVDLLG